MSFDVSSIFAEREQVQQTLQKADAPRTPETVGSEIRYLSHQAKCMTVWFGVEIGKRLAEAKAMVGHGGWLNFLKSETEFSKDSAARFMRIAAEYGDNSNFATLRNLSVSNALRLLAVPAEEREEFAKAVDAENLSARELAQAIRERDEARRQLDTEKERSAQLRQESAEQSAKIKELESRPVEVAVEAADPAEIEKAVADALNAAEKKHKAELADLENRRKTAEARYAVLHTQFHNTLDAAKRDHAQGQKPQANQPDDDATVFRNFLQAAQENFNRAFGLLHKVKLRDADTAAKLSDYARDVIFNMQIALGNL